MKWIFANEKKTVAKTLLVSYTIIVSICVIVTGIVSIWYENFLKRENDSLNQYIFTGVSQSVYETLNDMRTLNKYLLEDTSIQAIVENQSEEQYWNFNSTFNGIEQLGFFARSKENIDLCFIYLKLSDEVVSQNGILSSSMFYDMYFAKSGVSFENWLTILRENEKERYINLNLNTQEGIISALVLMSPISREKNAVSVIAINKEKFLRGIEQFEMREYSDVYVYNPYNRLIIYEKNIESETIPYTLSELKKIAKSDSKTTYTISEDDNYEGYTVVTAVSNRIVGFKIFFQRIVVISIYIVFVVILIFLIKYFIRQNTKNLKKVTSMLRISTSENEYKSMYDAVEQILSENLSLMNEQNRLVEKIKQMYLAGLLKEKTTSSHTDANQELKFSGKYFAIITFYLENIDMLFPEDISMSFSKREDCYRIIIRNIFEEKLNNDDCKGFVTEVDGLSVCLVNLHQNNQEVLGIIKEIADEAVQFINDKFELNLSFVLSGIYSQLTELPQGYVKTLESLEYKKRLGIQSSLYCAEISFDYSDGYLINLDKENKLIQSIRSGNIEESQKIIDQVFSLLEGKQSLSQNYISYTIQDIWSIITKTAAELPGNKADIQSEILSFQRLSDLSVHDSYALIKKRLEGIQGSVLRNEKEQNEKSCKRIQKITDFVEKNYNDASLNVAGIGRHFEMSPYYVSKLFKDATGITLIDYLNGYRIKKAKELMENSNLSGKAIAEQVGFNHVRTFYRLLKQNVEREY